MLWKIKRDFIGNPVILLNMVLLVIGRVSAELEPGLVDL